MERQITIILFNKNKILTYQYSNIDNVNEVISIIENMYYSGFNQEDNICIRSLCSTYTRITMFFRKNKHWDEIEKLMRCKLKLYSQEFRGCPCVKNTLLNPNAPIWKPHVDKNTSHISLDVSNDKPLITFGTYNIPNLGVIGSNYNTHTYQSALNFGINILYHD